MKLIASKYKSHCRKCNGNVFVGDNVYWEKNKGVVHYRCYEQNNPVEIFEKKENKNYLLFLLRSYMFLSPLLYGPVYEVMGMNDALTYCLSIPLMIAIFTGLKPTGLRVRVKWSSRRAYQGDVFGTLVLLEVALSFVITWVLKNILMILK